MKKILLLFLITANIVNIFAQDTIICETTQEYPHEVNKYKGYASSLEIIKFSNDFYKLEECYYVKRWYFNENKRVVFEWETESYKFINDSVLLILGISNITEKWIYHKENDTTYIVKELKNRKVVRSGKASKLVPLIKHGKFTYYKPDGSIFYYKFFSNNRCVEIESKKQDQVKEDEEIFLNPEEMPEFPGGENALQKFIADSLEYPEIFNDVIFSGKIHVMFLVTKTGEINDIHAVGGGNPILCKEAVRVVSMFPNFNPGKYKGKPVNVYYTIPIDFEIYKKK